MTLQQLDVRGVGVRSWLLFGAQDSDCSLDVTILNLGSDCGSQQLIGVPLLPMLR